jgi:glycosyltransferase involved in cell wall biosynthesis
VSDRRTKVLFLTYGFGLGGAEVLLVNVLNGLNRARIEPIVVTLAAGGELESRIDDGIKLIRYPRRFKLDFKPCLDIARLVRSEAIHSIFVLDLFTYLFAKLATLGRTRKMRVLVSVHTTTPKSIKEALLTQVYARMLHSRALLVSVCKAQARYLSQRYSIPLQRFLTVYNGVDTDHWMPRPPDFDRAAAREALGIEKDAAVILQVAAVRPEKAHHHSIEALSIIHSTTALRPYLLFVGGGSPVSEARLRSLARSRGVERHVLFCGQQADPRCFYWTGDLFTLSSTAVETFSIAALEAMSTGLPCVLTDLGGASEMIADGANGYVVPAGRPDRLAAAWRRVLAGELTWPPGGIRDEVVRRFGFETCVRSYENALLS